MKYLSICSGIEAATTAWHDLGWTPFAFSEIEAFPCAVLKHHWPHVPNLGDMARYDQWESLHEVNLLVGGTPCQAFSVAGLRNSLDDARGNLTLTYVQILNKIDHERKSRNLSPAICLWENVPGVLNTKDNAFGCFLGALAGEDAPLEPAGGRWTNAGYVRGPERTIAWVVKDAQYFGVAQRRRRVFVVASARDGFCPEQILFESEGVRRDSPPSREKGEGIAERAGAGIATWWDGGGIAASLTTRSHGQEMPDKGNFFGVIAPTVTSKWAKGSGGPAGAECGNLVIDPKIRKLTPVECARLQGFPDHHARIPWRGKPAEECPDGPQYKAYGNSMAVPCMRWLGERIDQYLFGGYEI